LTVNSFEQVIEQTVCGLGYDLVEIQFSARGLLAVTIDLPDQPRLAGAAVWEGEFVTVEDCEKVSRQLSYVLTVENLDYSRLEVSSPGLDRPLNKPQDFIRFAGQEISLRLREPVQGRRHFEGLLSVQEDGQLALDWDDKPKLSAAERVKQAAKSAGKKVSKKVEKNTEDVINRLSFEFADVEKANLVPQVVFNRKNKTV
jgi:ribosome maturation factor RimP